MNRRARQTRRAGAFGPSLRDKVGCNMTTPQEPAKRRKQKIRRTKRLEAWRAAHPKPPATEADGPGKGGSK